MTGTTPIRTFIAIDLPSSVQESIQNQATRLHTLIGSGSIRWVPPVNIHLTLKFLGNIPAPHLDFLKQMLIGIAERAKPFDMQISGIGSFPSSKRPRIIWAGIHAPAALFSLQKEIEEKSTRFGYEKETKTFSPHLTIGRVHQEATAKELERIGNALASIQLGGIITSRVDSVHLYQSDLNPKGSIYTKLFSVPLRWNLNTLDLARDIVYALEDKKGENIILMDIKDIASFTDYFVICTGTSDRMLDALANTAIDEIRKKHKKKTKKQGLSHDGWVVVDFGDVVLHLLSPDQREYYQLEELWEEGKVLLRLQ